MLGCSIAALNHSVLCPAWAHFSLLPCPGAEVWVGNDVVANGPPIYLTKVHPGAASLQWRWGWVESEDCGG